MTILITCATAKTSRRLIALLHPENELLLASRSGQSIGTAPGVCFDWDVPKTWTDVFEHEQARKSPLRAVYLVTRANTVDPAATAVPFIALCQQRGVRRVVLLGGSALDVADCSFRDISAKLTQLQRQCGLEWALLRPSWFMRQ